MPETYDKVFKERDALLDVLLDVHASLETLYKNAPVIAGEYFGAALNERLKEAINKTKGGTDE